MSSDMTWPSHKQSGLQRDAREQLPLWHGEKCQIGDGMYLGHEVSTDLWSHGKRREQYHQTWTKPTKFMFTCLYGFTWISSYLFVLFFFFLSRLYPYFSVSFFRFWVPYDSTPTGSYRYPIFFVVTVLCSSFTSSSFPLLSCHPYCLNSVQAGTNMSESSRIIQSSFMVSSIRPGKLHVLWCCTAARQVCRAQIRICSHLFPHCSKEL